MTWLWWFTPDIVNTTGVNAPAGGVQVPELVRAELPHFSFPLRTVGGKFVLTEQDSTDEIVDCAHIVACFPRGWREEEPDFGVDDQTFTTEFDETLLMAQIEEWEPRAEMVAVDGLDEFDHLIRRVKLGIKEREQ